MAGRPCGSLCRIISRGRRERRDRREASHRRFAQSRAAPSSGRYDGDRPRRGSSAWRTASDLHGPICVNPRTSPSFICGKILLLRCYQRMIIDLLTSLRCAGRVKCSQPSDRACIDRSKAFAEVLAAGAMAKQIARYRLRITAEIPSKSTAPSPPVSARPRGSPYTARSAPARHRSRLC